MNFETVLIGIVIIFLAATIFVKEWEKYELKKLHKHAKSQVAVAVYPEKKENK